MLGFLLVALTAAVLWIAWPSTSGANWARWCLYITMGLIPWLAWLYWVPRGMRYRLGQRRPGAQGQAITTIAAAEQRRASLRFWQERQRNGTPTEQALAPQMLAFLKESTPSEVFDMPRDETWPPSRLLDTEYK
jgi:hypothetical protein